MTSVIARSFALVLKEVLRKAGPHAAARRGFPLAFSAAIGFLVLGCLASHASAEIDLPEVNPRYKIHVEAETYANVQRGAYDVLAFEGSCRLRQGDLVLEAQEITLWIERNSIGNATHAGKVICLAEGSVSVAWGDGRQLRDHRWMGRLFSYYAISVDRGRPVTRYDIPNMDWSKERNIFQLAQFSRSGDEELMAPPLLGTPSTTPSRTAPPQSSIPSTPGATPWNPNATANQESLPAPSRFGSTQDSEFTPNYGIVIPESGAPYPAAGTPNLPITPAIEPENLAPAFPSQQPTAPLQQPTVTLQQPQIALQPQASPFAAKSVQFLQRDSGTKIDLEYDEARGEAIGQIKGGFKLIVEGVQVTDANGQVSEFGNVSLEADNAVLWVRSDGPINLFDLKSTADRPIELYLEGNIVFFQDNRVIYADRMYYNVSSEYGMVLSAEVLTPVPQYQGLLRLKADVLEQQNSRSFKAYSAAITSSRLGVPRYWLQAQEVEFEDQRSETDLTVFAPTVANRPTQMRATSRGNFAYLGGFPIFFWPTFSTDLSEPSFYLSSLRFKNDSIFGFQTYAEWDAYQLLGIDGPEGTDLKVSTDYLSDRGPALGARFEYNRPTWLFGAPGVGYSDSWFISDDGTDFLGTDRFGLVPEEDLRGRSISRHRIFLSPNWELSAETGWISDRNFLEQYFENEWDQEKDFATELRLRRYNGNRLFEVRGGARVNDFFTETEWLPRIDHYWLGQDLIGQRLTWNAHSSIGYGHQRPASTPVDPVDAAKFALLPWESDSEGLRATTRHELNLPFNLGALKIVPFLSGEAAFWNEDVNQDDVTRLTGQAGVRSALPMWSVYPNVENRLFDLRGIAHKVVFESELFYADSSEDLDRLPLYDPLDDNAQEHYRRRFVFNTFGGALPPEFDERHYAFRSGMQRWVTAGSTEIVDDLTQLRLGVNQRWQTKRGLPGSERIVDLVTLDTNFIFFPKAERDNFGEDVGAMTYDFRYHVGDRLTLLSDGYFDVFSQGLKLVSAGAQISRPGKGDAYLGMLSIEGPISANILNGYTNYRMNEKWILSAGAAFDFADTGSIGQNLALTRIGESALIRVGVNIDHGRDNVSFNFNIEPRFLPTLRLGMLGGELVPPAGLYGLE